MSEGQHHPHVHIMFSERQIDEVEQKRERAAKAFFLYPARRKKDGSEPSFEEKWKRGAPKARKWADKNFLTVLRADFAQIQNEVLSRNNFSIRVDHRTLKAQKEEAERVVNVGGVKNLINLCTACNLQFIQISTMSTVRNGIKGEVDENATPNETTLYFRQMLTNKYVHSKFLAERLVLDAVAEDGINAKIMRVGTLSARYSDGEFQINADTNSSMGRLKIFAILGCCPFAQMDNLIEFSPIDEVAKTILILSETPKECVIFHPINHHNMSIGDVVRSMKSCGIEINFVEQEDFQAAWQAVEEDPDKAKILTRGCW